MNIRSIAKVIMAGMWMPSLLIAASATPAALPMTIGARSQPPHIIAPLGLVARVQSEGSVRVIIKLNVSALPEGELPDVDAVDDQRRAIAAAQEAVIESLANNVIGFDASSVRKFEFIPFLALTVDPVGLSELEQNSGISEIAEDRVVPAALAESTPLIHATNAWASGYTGSGQTVAILDTGVSSSHSFLTGKVVSEACYSTTSTAQQSTSVCPGGVAASTASGSGAPCTVSGCEHGTHVAGIAAGSGTSFSGVAKGAKIIAIQIFSRFSSATSCSPASAPCVLTYTSDQIAALDRVYALRSTFTISSVNMSIGGGRYFSSSSCDAANSAEKASIDNLRSVGIATVIAAGNDGFKDSLGSPGCISTAISVGSTVDAGSAVDTVSGFSNSATFLNLLAPGQVITSSVPGNTFANLSGTSMATPHVTGALAVLRQKCSSATVTQLLAALSSSGVGITDTNGLVKPRIKVDSALNAVCGGVPPPSNDNCASATTLSSGTSCSFTSGSVLGATASGPAKPSCDGAASPNMFDVWYKFTAVSTSQTVTVVPATAVGDPVVAVYSSCGGSQIGCSDSGGGGVTETLPLSGLTVGSTYYVRVYDYGVVEPVGTDANFQICVTGVPVTYALSITGGGSGQGTVTGSGINCSINNGSTSGTCSASYSAGTGVSLTATATSGSTFSGWGGACAGSGGCSVTMNGNTSVSASFTGTSYTLSVTGGGTGQGTVTAPGINCTISAGSASGTCSATYASGSAVSLSATPTGGSTFTGWGGACSGTGGCGLTMNANKSVSATFTGPINNYTLSVTGGGTGQGTVTGTGINCTISAGSASGTCSAIYASGSSVTLAATPTGNSTFSGWGGACSGTGGCGITMNANKSVSASFTTVITTHIRNDFDGDGKADVFWRNTSGTNAVWFMNGGLFGSGAYTSVADLSWTVAGAGDFNGDGKTDLLWRNTSGLVAVWLMNGASIISSGYVNPLDSTWTVAGVGDFNGDGRDDILWRHSSGTNAIWFMNGIGISTGLYTTFLSSDWTAAAVGDFNGDHKADILWRHTSGINAVWLMDGAVRTTGAYVNTLESAWTLVATGDFDGDGKADVFWRNASGTNAIWFMDGAVIRQGAYTTFVDPSWAAVATGDFNGDGKADLMWRSSDSRTAIWIMNGTALTGTYGPLLPSSWISRPKPSTNGQ